MAATNSYIQYMSDHHVFVKCKKKRLQYFDFKFLLAKEMIYQAQGDGNQQDKVGSDDFEMSCVDEQYIVPKRRSTLRKYGVLPLTKMVDAISESRCRRAECKVNTSVKCNKCTKFLYVSRQKNFLVYHS